MSTSAGFGRIIGRDLTKHYDYESRSSKVSRLSGIKDLVGNAAYFSLRGALRVCAIALRILDAIAHIPTIFCNPDTFVQKIKLVGLSAARLITPPVQIFLSTIGSALKILGPCQSLQKGGVILLRFSHEIDNYFDQMELDIAQEVDECEGSDFRMNLIFPPYIPLNGRMDHMKQAITGGHVNAVARLIKNGYPINAKDYKKNTLLHIAVRNQQAGVAIRLIELGANFSLKNNSGETPLHLAAKIDLTVVVDRLVREGKQRVDAIEGIVEKMPRFPAEAEHMVSQFFDYTNESRNIQGLTAHDLASLYHQRDAAQILHSEKN